jgi:hypothetical protein
LVVDLEITAMANKYKVTSFYSIGMVLVKQYLGADRHADQYQALGNTNEIKNIVFL